MTWGTPAAFWLLGLIVPVTGLFLYRRRAILTVVPSIAFWTSRTGALSGSPLGRRLRHVVTFLIQITILSLLVLALADPQPVHSETEETILIIDCSATMQTSESGGTRLDQATTRAREVIDALPGTSRVTVIRAGQFPEVVLRGEKRILPVQATMDSLEAADTDADLVEALTIVQDMKHAERPQRVILISDFCGTDVHDLNIPSMDLILLQVGAPQPNLGIVDVTCLPDQHELVAQIGRNDIASRQCAVSVVSDNVEIAHEVVDIDGSLTEVHFPVTLQQGEEFTVILDPPDPLMLDNVAHGVYPSSSTLSIRLVSPGNTFLEQALRAYPDATLDRVHPEVWKHDDVPDVTILDGPVLAALPTLSGTFIVFSPISGSFEPEHALSLVSWQADHPVLASSEPISWGYLRGMRLPPLENSRMIVAGQDSAILYEWPDPETVPSRQGHEHLPESQAIIFNFNLLESELPYLPAFPVLLWDTLFYITGKGDSLKEAALPTGSTVIVRSASRSSPPLLTDPGGRSGSMQYAGDHFIWNATEKQGIYRYQLDEVEHKVAMNWMSMGSTLTWDPILSPAGIKDAQVSGADAVFAGAWWRILLMTVAAMVAMEWLLFVRKILRMD